MKKKVLIIMGHPDTDSYASALADAYQKGAERVAEVRQLNVAELKFDPILHKAYKEIQELEPDLLNAQKDIKWADHIVWVYPTWFGSPPALMMGFISRVFHPSFAFKYKRKTDLIPYKLLKGRSARLIITMDDYPLIDNFVFRHSIIRVMKKSVLWLSGIKPIRSILIGPVKRFDLKKRKKWLEKIEGLGRRVV